MFDTNRYRYLVLNSCVPAVDRSLLSQGSQLRLETLCALAIVRSKVKCHLLSNTPMHLHKILWTAYLRDEYYAHRDSLDLKEVPIEESELFLNVLPELFYHWPHEEFVLEEIMPQFPPKTKRFSHFWGWDDGSGPYNQNNAYLFAFYDLVVNSIICCCIDNNGRFPGQHKYYGNIRKVNFSGFYMFTLREMQFLSGITNPFYKNKDNKLEIMLDVYLDCENIESIENWFRHWYSKCNNKVVCKVGRIVMWNINKTEEVTRIISKLVNDGAFSITLHTNDGSEIIEKVFENANQKNILTLDLVGCVTSLDIMLYFVNLIHLDLSNNDLHDKLNFLLHMHRGLLILSLNDCKLKNKDLDKIIRSCHQSTLRLLDLNSNLFQYDDNSEYLIRLCESLTNVQELDLGICCLESWPLKDIQLFLISLKMLPNIIRLDLDGEYFRVDTINKHVIKLGENSSLRYLYLSLPLEVYEDHAINVDEFEDFVRSFNSEFNAKINKVRSQLLYVEFVF